MTQLQLELRDDQLEALHKIASLRSLTVSAVIEAYVQYLLAGGRPIEVTGNLPDGLELATLAERGGAFDWLLDEPDIYTLDDGEPV